MDPSPSGVNRRNKFAQVTNAMKTTLNNGMAAGNAKLAADGITR